MDTQQAITYPETRPHNPEAEKAVLGSILIDAEIYNKLQHLRDEDFYIERNRWVWQAIKALKASGQDVDYLTICETMEKSGKLTEAGGPARIMSLINSTPTSLHAESYAALMIEETTRRRTLDVAQMLAAASFDRSKPVNGAVSKALDKLSRAIVAGKGAGHITELLSQVYDEVSEAIQNPREITGITTGLRIWDLITGGLQLGTVIKLTGDPGVGKSLLAMQILIGAGKAGHGGALYELEMKGTQVIRRSLSAESGIATAALRTGKITEEEIPVFIHSVEALSRLPIYISDEPHMTTAELRADLTRLKDSYNIEIAVIDYEALLADEGENENARRNNISDQVHAMAKSLNLAIISIGDKTKEGIQGKIEGQGAAAGTGHELHNADEIVFLDQSKTDPNLIDVKWAKLREPNGYGNGMQLYRAKGLPAFVEVTQRPEPGKAQPKK